MRDSDVQKPPGIAEAIDWLAALDLLGVERLDAAAVDRTLGVGAQVRRGPGGDPRGRPRAARAAAVTRVRRRDRRARPARRSPRRFSRRLHDAGVPVDARAPGRRSRARSTSCARSAAAACTGPRAPCSSPTRRTSRRSTPSSAPVFGDRATAAAGARGRSRRRRAPRRREAGRRSRGAARRRRRARATARGRGPARAWPSDEERLASKRFDALEPGELAQLYRLMARLELATAAAAHAPPRARPPRPADRPAPDAARRPAHRRRADPPRAPPPPRAAPPAGDAVRHLRLDGALRPRLPAVPRRRRRQRAVDVEAFAFATRLTRLTRALRGRHPERAIQRAAQTAPDWSSGTRIGDALKAFNDRHGRRGMARGAVVVILSDGWERGDPALVGREMARLARLAHRIVWVNPRVGASAFSVRAGGMVAALPHCDALVSGHSFARARRGRRRDRRRGRRGPRPAPAGRSRSRGRARRRCPAARSRCRAATARAAGTRRRGGRSVAEKTCIYPGCERPAVPPHPLGGPQPAFCDLEEHNALTAHQERQRLEREKERSSG